MGDVIDLTQFRQKKQDADSMKITVGVNPDNGLVMIVIQNLDASNIIIGLDPYMAVSLGDALKDIAATIPI